MDKVNQWLTLAANVGVLAGIIFLALEIQQNTAAINRQAGIERTARIMQPYIHDIPSIYKKIKAVDGDEPLTKAFEDRYSLDTEEAVSWTAFLTSNWQAYESDFLSLGPSKELAGKITYMVSFSDNQLLWSLEKASYDKGFAEYVESLRTD